MPAVEGSEAAQKEHGLCLTRLRSPFGYFPLSNATTEPFIARAPAALSDCRPVSRAAASPAFTGKPSLHLRMFSFGLAGPLGSEGLNAA